MPRKKGLHDYLREFHHDVLSEKYGFEKVTPEIYQKEVLGFISKMDSDFVIKNIVEFINMSAYNIADEKVAIDDGTPASEKLYPYQFFGDLLDNNVPTKKVYDEMKSNMSKQAYVDYCDQLRNDPGTGSKNNVIEYKMNKLRMLESLKPTGNKVSRFFKKLFNIGGYNDKLAAYERCKQSVKELVGNQLSDEEFEASLQSSKRFSLLKSKESKSKKINLTNEFEKEVSNNQISNEKEPEKEIVNELIK